MLYFTTYFDKNYLSRGLVLYDSLKEHSNQFELYLLCLDEFTMEFFQNKNKSYPEIKLISLNEIEAMDTELKACKIERNKIEYYFTLSPCLPLYVLKRFELPHICSLDADILFLDNPKTIFNFLKQYSIIITPHKFSEEIKELVKFGIYNVSFQIFKNDVTGIKCLKYWRKECIDWCRDQYDEKSNRFADQKYLDKWTELYRGKVKVLDDNVNGIAPWNLNKYKITKKGNKFYSNNDRMVFYHFHHFKMFNNICAANSLYMYQVKSSTIIRKLYLLYWNKLNQRGILLSLLNNQSARFNYSDNIWVRIFNEKFIDFKVMSKRLFRLNVSKIPNIVKRILIKINA